MWHIARESVEFVGPVTVTVNGVAHTVFQVAVTKAGTRPSVWSAPDTVGSDLGVLVGPGTSRALSPGGYDLWAKVTDTTPEVPVMKVRNGRINIT
jgi:hypothetical protein